jgi:hypothetical protein
MREANDRSVHSACKVEADLIPKHQTHRNEPNVKRLMDYVRGEIAFSQVFQVEKREKREEKRGRFKIFSRALQPKI